VFLDGGGHGREHMGHNKEEDAADDADDEGRDS